MGITGTPDWLNGSAGKYKEARLGSIRNQSLTCLSLQRCVRECKGEQHSLFGSGTAPISLPEVKAKAEKLKQQLESTGVKNDRTSGRNLYSTRARLND